MVNNSIREFFNSMAPNWDEICIFNMDNINRILQLAKVGEGHRIVDVGCGTGVLIDPLLQCGVKEIYAVDLSKAMIDKAREKYCNPSVRFEATDFLRTDKTGYDCVIVHNAYPHFLDKEALVAAICNTLKVGGRFVVAHSDSRDKINGCHHKINHELSSYLQPAVIEAKNFEEMFAIDTIIDDAEIFMISGVRKESSSISVTNKSI